MRVPFRKLWIAAIPSSLIILSLSIQCSDKNDIGTFLMISTLFLSAWTTQYSISVGELSYKWYEYPFSLLYNLCFLLLISVPIAIFTPAYECYPSDRAKVSEALSSISPLKSKISSSLMGNNEILHQELEHPSMYKNVAYLEVQKDGNIIVLTAVPNAIIRLTPERSGETIKWRCNGRPHKFVPAQCRW